MLLTPVSRRPTENLSLPAVVNQLAEGTLGGVAHVGKLVRLRLDAAFLRRRAAGLHFRLTRHDSSLSL